MAAAAEATSGFGREALTKAPLAIPSPPVVRGKTFPVGQ
eukprot:gene9848-8759_t